MDLRLPYFVDGPDGQKLVGSGDARAVEWLARKLCPADPRIHNPMWFLSEQLTGEQMRVVAVLRDMHRVRVYRFKRGE